MTSLAQFVFAAAFAVQDFLWEIVRPNTPAPSKKAGPFLSLILSWTLLK